MMSNRAFATQCSMLLCLVGHLPSTTAAAAAIAAEQLELSSVTAVILGMKDEREKARQGVVEITGQSEDGSAQAGSASGEIRYLVAFDKDADLLRVEREEPRRRIDAKDVSMSDHLDINQMKDAITIGQSRSIFFRTPSRLVRYRLPSYNVSIFPATVNNRFYGCFDLMATGILMRQSYVDGVTFDDILGFYLKSEPDSIVSDDDGVYRIRWTLFKGMHRRTLWVDTRNGFTPTRLEVQDRRKQPSLTENEWPRPYLVSNASWKQLNSVWVPSTFAIEHQFPSLAAGDTTTKNSYWRREHNFEWVSVNQPLREEKYFSIDSLPLKKGTLIVNYLGSTPITERVVGVDDEKAKHLLGDATTVGASSKGIIRPAHGIRTWIVIVNLVVVIILLAVLVFRRKYLRR